MAGATVTLYTRIAGVESFGTPQFAGGGINILVGSTLTCQTYMPHPYGQGDITWQGTLFGLPAPGGTGAQVQDITFSLTHRVSDPGSFSQATAQILAGSAPVGPPATLTLSSISVTDTFSIRTGYAAAQLPNLTLQVTYHAVAPSLAYVISAYASASYSYPNAITGFTIDPVASMPAPQVNVALPPGWLRSLGAEVGSFHPSFGALTLYGNLLTAWVFSNSSSVSFNTTCSDPSWSLAVVAGGAFNWLSLWYKPQCNASETPPVFASSGASTPMSQLAEFTARATLDQAGTGSGNSGFTVTAPGADTYSGDLVVAVYAWNGSNAGPTAITMSAADSSAAVMPMALTSNASSSGKLFYAFGWGRAGGAFGPRADSATATLGVFAPGNAIIASFSLGPLTSPPVQYPASITNRVAIVGTRIG